MSSWQCVCETTVTGRARFGQIKVRECGLCEKVSSKTGTVFKSYVRPSLYLD